MIEDCNSRKRGQTGQMRSLERKGSVYKTFHFSYSKYFNAERCDGCQVEDWPDWVHTLSCSSHLLTTFNSSVNFFIYFIKYKQRKNNNQSLTSVDMEILTTTLV